MYLFRWEYNTITEIIYSEKEIVKSEEGVTVMPVKTFAEFSVDDYDCLVLPGCSSPLNALCNNKLNEFLKGLKNYPDFIIAAICSGPMFLEKAELLKGKKYTDSLFVEMRELYNFIEEENFLPQSVVESGNVLTAQGNAFNDFAVVLARKLGYSCPDRILKGYIESDNESDFIYHLPSEEDLVEFKEEFKEFITEG